MPDSNAFRTRPFQTTDRTYALDPGWYAERERLQSMTRIYDPTTLRLAEQLGLAPGWRCADVGAGTGSTAQLLAAAVGAQGHVLAVDTDTRFLDPLADATLTVVQQDITAEPLPAGQFDLVHARLLLEHLPRRDAVLGTLAAALTPGGWLLIEDLDWVTATVTDPPTAVHERVVTACRTVLEAHGYDPAFARCLPRALRAAGLVAVGAVGTSAQIDADPVAGVPQWELLAEQLAPAMLGAALVTEEDLREFSAHLRDGDTVVFAPLMVSSWGRRPPAGADRAG